MKPNILVADSETLQDCFPVIVKLRPHLTESQFIEQVERQWKQGYQIAYVKDNSEVVAVGGFRILESLAWGKYMYIDDLVTNEGGRSKGYGTLLLEWLAGYARKNSCDELHLDSGTQRKRAHKFYLSNNLEITSFHFATRLK